MVLRGVSPREAWERCGKPKGEAGIQNIRKRAREERARPQAAPPPEPRRAASGPGRGVPKAGFRLRKEQRTVIVQQQKDLKQQYAQAYADATADWQRRVSAGKTGKGFASTDAARGGCRQGRLADPSAAAGAHATCCNGGGVKCWGPASLSSKSGGIRPRCASSLDTEECLGAFAMQKLATILSTVWTCS